MTYHRKAAIFAAKAAALLVSVSVSSLVHAQTAESDAPPAGDDIIVTAQHREQRLQDVGIAVSAIQGTQLKQLDVNNATDLVRVVPTLKMNAFSSSQVVFNIRGVSLTDYGDQQEPPIAVYQDDSYGSSINLSSFPIFDLARAEVLRGPQGTLFGRNATGGAIQFISNQPTKYLDGYVTVATGSYGKLRTESAISGPLTDRLQVRLAGIRDRDTGYFKNIAGGPDLMANNHWALRGILAWQPTDTISASLTVRYMRAPHERQGGAYSLNATCPNDHLQGEFLPANVTCPFWAGNGLAGPGTTATGLTNDAINPQRGGDPWKLYQTGENYSDREIYGSTLHASFELGRFTLVSITDYQHSRKNFLESSLPDPGELFEQNSRLKQGTQEFRLSSHLGAHELVVGAYGLINKGSYLAGYAIPFLDYYPLAISQQRTRSFALFAQDEWTIAPGVKLIGGVRYWNDERKGDYTVSEASTGVGLTFNQHDVFYTSHGVRQPSTGINVSPSDAKQTFEGVTIRAQVNYKPSASTLLYASYNRGSKSGGFTFLTSSPLPGGEADALNGIPYKPETLNAYEVGAKLTLPLSTTLNLAAFYYDYQDYQAFAQLGFVQTILNRNAKAKGIEADLTTQPFPGFTLQASGSLLDTKVKNVPLPDGVSIVERDLPQSPGFSGSLLARYEFPLFQGTAFLQGDLQYSGKFCFTLLCAPVEREGNYTVGNLRVGFSIDRYDIAAFVNNVGETKYRVYATDASLYNGSSLGVYAPPRTWGLTGTVHFGQ